MAKWAADYSRYERIKKKRSTTMLTPEVFAMYLKTAYLKDK